MAAAAQGGHAPGRAGGRGRVAAGAAGRVRHRGRHPARRPGRGPGAPRPGRRRRRPAAHRGEGEVVVLAGWRGGATGGLAAAARLAVGARRAVRLGAAAGRGPRGPGRGRPARAAARRAAGRRRRRPGELAEAWGPSCPTGRGWTARPWSRRPPPASSGCWCWPGSTWSATTAPATWPTQALERAFVIAVDHEVNETTSQADVLLPGVVHAETEGTFTDWEGRVQATHRAVPVGGAAQEIWDLAASSRPASGSTSGSAAPASPPPRPSGSRPAAAPGPRRPGPHGRVAAGAGGEPSSTAPHRPRGARRRPRPGHLPAAAGRGLAAGPGGRPEPRDPGRVRRAAPRRRRPARPGRRGQGRGRLRRGAHGPPAGPGGPDGRPRLRLRPGQPARPGPGGPARPRPALRVKVTAVEEAAA